VSLAEKIIPAADISEQISTAGTEASGTGNMKLAMNGALTVGTLDGANIEILEAVGRDNIYVFGLTTEEVHSIHRAGSYNPDQYCQENPAFGRVLESIGGNFFCPDEPGIFRPLYDRLSSPHDPYLHLADLRSYVASKRQIAIDYNDAAEWSRKAILNVARMDGFTSDRTITQYANEIWSLKPAPVD
jgi:starch phosphorylase